MKTILITLALLALSTVANAYDGRTIKASQISDEQIEKMVKKLGVYYGLDHLGNNPLEFSDVVSIQKYQDLDKVQEALRLGALNVMDSDAVYLLREIEFVKTYNGNLTTCDMYIKIAKGQIQNLADMNIYNCHNRDNAEVSSVDEFGTKRVEVTLILNGKE